MPAECRWRKWFWVPIVVGYGALQAILIVTAEPTCADDNGESETALWKFVVAVAPVTLSNMLQMLVSVWAIFCSSLSVQHGSALQRITAFYFVWNMLFGVSTVELHGRYCAGLDDETRRSFFRTFGFAMPLSYAMMVGSQMVCMVLRLHTVCPSLVPWTLVPMAAAMLSGAVFHVAEMVDRLQAGDQLRAISAISYSVAAGCFLWCCSIAFVGFRRAAAEVELEAQRRVSGSNRSSDDLAAALQKRSAARWLWRTAWWTALRAGTAVVFTAPAIFVIQATRSIEYLPYFGAFHMVLVTCDNLYTLLLAELLSVVRVVRDIGKGEILFSERQEPTAGPVVHSTSKLQVAAKVVAERREREIQLKLQFARQNAASTVAGLLRDRDPGDVLEMAKARFRHISWDDLRDRYEIIAGGGLSTNDGRGAGTDLYELSRPASLGACDTFLSHSWHDDPRTKWDALSSWCERFREEHGKAPTLWLDKVCIDQTDISTDLICLPVFLAACQSMLILAGPTYTSRLWCTLELYTYIAMQGAEASSGKATIVPLNGDDSNFTRTLSLWKHFDVEECQCFCPEDKSRILSIIEANGGLSVFNEDVRSMVSQFFRTRSGFQTERSSFTSSSTVGVGPMKSMRSLAPRIGSWLTAASRVVGVASTADDNGDEQTPRTPRTPRKSRRSRSKRSVKTTLWMPQPQDDEPEPAEAMPVVPAERVAVPMQL